MHRGKIGGFSYSSEKGEARRSKGLLKRKPKKKLFMTVVLVGHLPGGRQASSRMCWAQVMHSSSPI